MGRRRRHRQALSLTSIAQEHGIAVHWTKHRWDAEAFPELSQVVIPKIRTTADYLLGLHELGHVLSPEARRLDQLTDPYSSLLCEGAAWAWAMAHADPGLVSKATEDDWGIVAEAIVSHWRWASTIPTNPHTDP